MPSTCTTRSKKLQKRPPPSLAAPPYQPSVMPSPALQALPYPTSTHTGSPSSSRVCKYNGSSGRMPARPIQKNTHRFSMPPKRYMQGWLLRWSTLRHLEDNSRLLPLFPGIQLPVAITGPVLKYLQQASSRIGRAQRWIFG